MVSFSQVTRLFESYADFEDWFEGESCWIVWELNEADGCEALAEYIGEHWSGHISCWN